MKSFIIILTFLSVFVQIQSIKTKHKHKTVYEDAVLYTPKIQKQEEVQEPTQAFSINKKLTNVIKQETANRQTLGASINNYMNDYYSFPDYPEIQDNQFQFNVNLIQPEEYREMVQKIIQTQPISQWPLVVRYCVFPRIYGYVNDKKLQTQLKILHEYELEKDPQFMRVSLQKDQTNKLPFDIEPKDDVRMDLLEKLSSHQQLKNMIDENLIAQAQKLLQSRKYEEKVDALIARLQYRSKLTEPNVSEYVNGEPVLEPSAV